MPLCEAQTAHLFTLKRRASQMRRVLKGLQGEPKGAGSKALQRMEVDQAKVPKGAFQDRS